MKDIIKEFRNKDYIAYGILLVLGILALYLLIEIAIVLIK